MCALPRGIAHALHIAQLSTFILSYMHHEMDQERGGCQEWLSHLWRTDYHQESEEERVIGHHSGLHSKAPSIEGWSDERNVIDECDIINGGDFDE